MQDPAVRHLVDVLVEDQKHRYSGGVERFLVSLATEAGHESFTEWSRNPVTQMFLGALKSLAETYANGIRPDPTEIALAYGAMSGLSLAARFIEDPTRVFPSIFDGSQSLMGREAPKPVSETYSVQPDTELPE